MHLKTQNVCRIKLTSWPLNAHYSLLFELTTLTHFTNPSKKKIMFICVIL